MFFIIEYMIDGLILCYKYLLLLQHINQQDKINTNILLITPFMLLNLVSGVIFSLKCRFPHGQRLASDSDMKIELLCAAGFILKAFFVVVFACLGNVLLNHSLFFFLCLEWTKEHGGCRDRR